MIRTALPVALCLLFLLGGCASSGTSTVDKTLEVLGLRKPDPATVELPPTDRKVTLRVHAGEQLNTGPDERSLSVVVRIYKLKDSAAFLAAPLSAFKDNRMEEKAFGNDIAEVREVVLRPGQKHEVVETLPLTIPYLGVTAQFRAPAEGRWRFAFDTKRAAATGITLGVHGCAMSVAAGEPVDTPPERLRLAGVQCR